VSAERLEVLRAWQEAARIERRALLTAREEIDALMDEANAGDYPQMHSLNARIEELEERVAPPTWLATLAQRQEDARVLRAELVEQDKRYRALTREIADVDDEIAARAKEIDRVAAKSGVRVDS
jgi:L-lactate utilization protein LutB